MSISHLCTSQETLNNWLMKIAKPALCQESWPSRHHRRVDAALQAWMASIRWIFCILFYKKKKISRECGSMGRMNEALGPIPSIA